MGPMRHTEPDSHEAGKSSGKRPRDSSRYLQPTGNIGFKVPARTSIPFFSFIRVLFGASYPVRNPEVVLHNGEPLVYIFRYHHQHY